MLMPWTPASVWAIRDANAEQLRTIDTFLDMGKATQRARPAAPPGRGRRHAVGEHHRGRPRRRRRCTPTTRSCRTCPTTWPQQCMTPTGRVLDQLAGLPGLDGTRADSDLRVGHRRRRRAARASSARRTCPIEVRRDWVMNANDSYWLPNPKQPLEGYAGIIGCEQCERTMRTRMVSHYVTRPAGGRARRSRRASLRGHEHENRVMAGEVMRAERRPRHALRRDRRDRGLPGAARLGRPLRHATSRGYAHLRGVHRRGCPTRRRAG